MHDFRNYPVLLVALQERSILPFSRQATLALRSLATAATTMAGLAMMLAMVLSFACGQLLLKHRHHTPLPAAAP
jgi:hypothetical protein